eukprot:403339974
MQFYVKQFKKLQLKRQKQVPIQSQELKTNHQILRDSSNLVYTDLNDKFRVTDKRDLIQYATFYYKRLSLLKDMVQRKSHELWHKNETYQNNGTGLCYLQNILDIQPYMTTVLIGTLFKEMPLKPCILSNLVGVISDDKSVDRYCSPEDYLVLEDSSGRIKIKKQRKINPDEFVTGAIVGFLGQVDKNGNFEVYDFCFAGLDLAQSGLQIPQTVKVDKNTAVLEELIKGINDNSNSNQGKNIVAFISGLEFGSVYNKQTIYQLLQFLRGDFGTEQEQKLSASIKRLIVCGNSIQEVEEQDLVNRGSFRTQKINDNVYTELFEVTDQFEEFLNKAAQFIDIDIMPGENDFQKDPFVIQEIPHVYFCGNQETYAEDTIIEEYIPSQIQECEIISQQEAKPRKSSKKRVLQDDDMEVDKEEQSANNDKIQSPSQTTESVQKEKKAVKIISIPKFRESGQLILLDLDTLKSYAYEFSHEKIEKKKYVSGYNKNNDNVIRDDL